MIYKDMLPGASLRRRIKTITKRLRICYHPPYASSYINLIFAQASSLSRLLTPRKARLLTS